MGSRRFNHTKYRYWSCNNAHISSLSIMDITCPTIKLSMQQMCLHQTRRHNFRTCFKIQQLDALVSLYSSFMSAIYNKGHNIEPCGTPHLMYLVSEYSLRSYPEFYLSDRILREIFYNLGSEQITPCIRIM